MASWGAGAWAVHSVLLKMCDSKQLQQLRGMAQHGSAMPSLTVGMESSPTDQQNRRPRHWRDWTGSHVGDGNDEQQWQGESAGEQS